MVRLLLPAEAKAAIVAADERETGDIRALLNLGHTFGHALEAETGFSSRLLHGEAVGIGMAQAMRFSAARGLCPAADADRLTAHLAWCRNQVERGYMTEAEFHAEAEKARGHG